jgi:predicted nucleotidyltransferase
VATQRLHAAARIVMPKRAPTRTDHLRSAVAQEAARLMAEHGIQDYLVAKRKAAERYGVVDGSVLPKNIEIEEALRSYQRLFGGAQHARSLQEQRRAALKAMQLLVKFEPRLVGAVLNGSATEHADIQLHVFSDSAETVYLHLLDQRYEYEVFERRMRMTFERQILVPSVRFAMGDEQIEAFVFPRDGIRQAPVSPVDGKPMRRANPVEVSALISQN